MRIEIHASGGGSVTAMQSSLSGLHKSINSTIESLRNVKSKMDNIPGDIDTLSDAVSSLQARIRTEELKAYAVEELSRKTTAFVSHTVVTDSQVASLVAVNQEKFYNTYTWLRPPAEAEKSWWEKFVDGWNDFWGDVGEVLGSVVDGIVEFVKEHAAELIVGAVAVVVGAAIVALTGGAATAFIPALLVGLKAAALSAVVGGAVSGMLALFAGGDILSAFGDGFASGFMWGGIFFVISSTVSAIQAFRVMKNQIPEAKFDNMPKLQKKFSSHAKDFGIDGNWNSVNGRAFQNAIQNHIDTAPEIYKTLFRGKEVYAYINPDTSLIAFVDLNGTFISGWSLNARQLLFHRSNGQLLNGGVLKKVSEIIRNITDWGLPGGICGGIANGNKQ